MAKTRLDLHKLLLNQTGLKHCYFSPPTGLRMKYPCLVYELAGELDMFADDISYLNRRRWEITVIDSNPDSEIPEKLKTLPFCRFDRPFTSDNLNHFVFTLFY